MKDFQLYTQKVRSMEEELAMIRFTPKKTVIGNSVFVWNHLVSTLN